MYYHPEKERHKAMRMISNDRIRDTRGHPPPHVICACFLAMVKSSKCVAVQAQQELPSLNLGVINKPFNHHHTMRAICVLTG